MQQLLTLPRCALGLHPLLHLADMLPLLLFQAWQPLLLTLVLSGQRLRYGRGCSEGHPLHLRRLLRLLAALPQPPLQCLLLCLRVPVPVPFCRCACPSAVGGRLMLCCGAASWRQSHLPLLRAAVNSTGQGPAACMRAMLQGHRMPYITTLCCCATLR